MDMDIDFENTSKRVSPSPSIRGPSIQKEIYDENEADEFIQADDVVSLKDSVKTEEKPV